MWVCTGLTSLMLENFDFKMFLLLEFVCFVNILIIFINLFTLVFKILEFLHCYTSICLMIFLNIKSCYDQYFSQIFISNFLNGYVLLLLSKSMLTVMFLIFPTYKKATKKTKTTKRFIVKFYYKSYIVHCCQQTNVWKWDYSDINCYY